LPAIDPDGEADVDESVWEAISTISKVKTASVTRDICTDAIADSSSSSSQINDSVKQQLQASVQLPWLLHRCCSQRMAEF
jgi:hypothetical protein